MPFPLNIKSAANNNEEKQHVVPKTDRKTSWTSEDVQLILTYLQVYFVTIATILGTGILGLPVTMAHSGFFPFLLSFLLTWIMQGAVIYLFTEVLQKASASQAQEADRKDMMLLKETTQDGETTESDSEVEEAAKEKPESPSLYTMADWLLGRVNSKIFQFVVYFQFLALLISYALAGSEAYADILNIRHVLVIPFFTLLLTVVIVFASRLVQPVVSLLTFAKGTLLVGTVIVTMMVGAVVKRSITDNFHYIGSSFLMGTVALGGLMNTMPMMYGRISSKMVNQVKWFNRCCFLGLTTCMVLNVAWCWGVLSVVPQVKCKDGTQVKRDAASVMSRAVEANNSAVGKCHTLHNSAKHGEISTIPLVQIINEEHSDFNWVASIIQVFIMISITVSFLTIGGALHHTLTGWVKAAWADWSHAACFRWMDNNRCCVKVGGGKVALGTSFSLTTLLFVFLFAMMNVQGFVMILDKVVSLFLNLETGIFLFLMVQVSRTKYCDLDIVYHTPSLLYHSHYVFVVFYTLAVIYDITATVYYVSTKKELTFG